jgi:RimJ/RimL family protein N-acetyltransferase
MLQGKLVRLRPVEREDAAAFARWSLDYEVMRVAGYFAATGLTRAEYEEKYEARRRDKTTLDFAVETVADKRLIGTVNLALIDWRSRTGFLGVEIGEKEYWGRGFGREAVWLLVHLAFEDLNLNRVGLGVWEFNERALRCMARLGFKREGRKRQVMFRDGRFWDEVLMSMLAAEYFGGADGAGLGGGAGV